MRPSGESTSRSDSTPAGEVLTRPLKRQMLIAFAAAMAIWVALTLGVSFALLRMRQKTSAILEVTTENIRLLSRLRAAKEATRGLAEGFVLKNAPPDIDIRLRDSDRAFRQEAREMLAALRRPSQLASWDDIQALHRTFRGLVSEEVKAAEAGRHAEAMELMDRANSASLDADAAYDRLAQSDALRADGLARTIDRQLLLLGLLAGLALALGSVATIALLRYALRALRAFVADVQQRLEDLDLVAARVVHDIRQPLTVVGLALTLAIRTTTDASTKARLGRALEILGRLGKTSEALLQFSRAGKPTERSVSTEASGVVREVVEELRAGPEAEGIEWETALLAQARVPMGRDALRVVMGNLLGNAVKYLEGRARKRISVSVREEGDTVDIRVEDTGPGIPVEHFTRLFEPFYRATTEKRGFGLGLATVRRLVTAHGGEVRLSSVVNQGTRFDVRFPKQDCREPGSGVAGSPRRIPTEIRDRGEAAI